MKDLKNLALWSFCMAEARRRVEASKREWPVDAVMLDVSVGGGSSESSTAFSRTGTESKTNTASIPLSISNLITQANEYLSLGNTDPHTSFLTSLLQRDQSQVPQSGALQGFINRSPSEYSWYSNLVNLTQKNPYSTDYETDTQGAYTNRLNNTLATLDSNTVRSGTNHQALVKGQAIADANRMRSEDLAKQRSVDAGIVTNAGQVLSALQQFIGQQALTAQGQLQQGGQANTQQGLEAGNQRTQRGGASMLGLGQSARMQGTQTEAMRSDLSGQGTQNQSNLNWGANSGVSCCFIFLEALNGELPPYVRRGRDEFVRPRTRSGYTRMSTWLVPAMRRFSAVRHAVNVLMIKPIMFFGAWHYKVPNETGRRFGWLCRPVFAGWRAVWHLLGKA